MENTISVTMAAEMLGVTVKTMQSMEREPDVANDDGRCKIVVYMNKVGEDRFWGLVCFF